MVLLDLRQNSALTGARRVDSTWSFRPVGIHCAGLQKLALDDTQAHQWVCEAVAPFEGSGCALDFQVPRNQCGPSERRDWIEGRDVTRTLRAEERMCGMLG